MTTIKILDGNILPLNDKLCDELNLNIGDILEFKIGENKEVSFKKVDREVSTDEFESNDMLVKVEELEDIKKNKV